MNEHQQLEYKQVWKDEFLKVICAFANSAGGRLVIGRADDCAAVGVSNARKLLEDIPNKVLLNALVHRDYSTGVPIQIRVYENRIRFSNDGRLPDGWTVEKLLEAHASKPANPLLAGAFFRTGDIESWGRGIDKIREACTAGGADFPTFDYEPTGLTVEFKAALPEGGSEDVGEKVGDFQEKTRVETRVKTRVKILELLRENRSMTRQELAEQLGLTLKGVDWQITQLKKSGDLRRVGSRKGGHWEVVE